MAECSGRGFKLEDGRCECFGEWTSFGDMRAQTHVDCDVSKIFVRVVYGLPLILFPYAFYHSAKELYILAKLKGWKRLCRMSNKIFVIHASTVMSSFALSAAYIEKIAEPERAIGIDPSVTWLFFIGMTFFFLVVASAFGLFVQISMKQEKFGGSKAIINVLRFAQSLIPCMSFAMFIAFALVLVAVYVRDMSVDAADKLIMAFWVIFGVIALGLLITTPLILHSACRDLDAMVRRHSSDGKADDVVRLSNKLKGIRRQSVFRGIINSTCFFVMGLFDQARYWGPYVIGIQAMLFSLIVIGLSTLTSTRSTGSSSSKNSSKDTKTAPRFGSKETVGSKDDDFESKRSTKEEMTIVGFVAAGPVSPSAFRSAKSNGGTTTSGYVRPWSSED